LIVLISAGVNWPPSGTRLGRAIYHLRQPALAAVACDDFGPRLPPFQGQETLEVGPPLRIVWLWQATHFSSTIGSADLAYSVLLCLAGVSRRSRSGEEEERH
jgi:hypothetical protein